MDNLSFFHFIRILLAWGQCRRQQTKDRLTLLGCQLLGEANNSSNSFTRYLQKDIATLEADLIETEAALAQVQAFADILSGVKTEYHPETDDEVESLELRLHSHKVELLTGLASGWFVYEAPEATLVETCLLGLCGHFESRLLNAKAAVANV